MSKVIKYEFNVKTIESGQRRAYGDSYYHYEVVTNVSEFDAKRFCMDFLKKSYEAKNMPDAFAGRFKEFKKITNNNEGKKWNDKREEETYVYKSEYLSTH